MDPDETLIDRLPEFMAALEAQLYQDRERWGDTWKHRPKEGQEERTRARFNDYFDKFEHAGKKINWLAVAGNAMICWVREQDEDTECC